MLCSQGYNLQIAVDSKSQLITADYVTNSANDWKELYDMESQARKALGAHTLDVLADQGYSSGKQFQQCYDNHITPYVPIMTPRSLIEADRRYKSAEFTFDKARNVYVCPAGLNAGAEPPWDGQIHRMLPSKPRAEVLVIKTHHIRPK